MKKFLKAAALAATMAFATQGAFAAEAIPAKECRVSTDGDDAECNVKNLMADYTVSCDIEVIGTTKNGEVFKNQQTRNVPSGKYVVIHVKHFGDYLDDPFVKVQGYAKCR